VYRKALEVLNKAVDKAQRDGLQGTMAGAQVQASAQPVTRKYIAGWELLKQFSGVYA
jgi:hypothetical protein